MPDMETKEKLEFKAKVIFLCASAMASVGILMQSKSERFPNGMGNDSDALGRGIMDHHYKLGAFAKVDGHLDKYYKGRRANGFYIPRFVNLDEKTKREGYIRGFGYQGTASRQDWSEGIAEMGYGEFAAGVYHDYTGLVVFFPAALLCLFVIDKRINARDNKKKVVKTVMK